MPSLWPGRRETARLLHLVSWAVLLLACPLAFPAPLRAAADRVFSIPLDDLKVWSQKVVVPFEVKITGHSAVHAPDQDCEMHFGAQSDAYKGDPPGLVLEPMNLCVEPFFGKAVYKKADWTAYGNRLNGKQVHAEGVPRIWPEHLQGQASPSNPHHAVELHPVTLLSEGHTPRDFSPFIFDPDSYEGGVKPDSAIRILTKTTVSVANHDGMAEVTFASGTIGNFSFLHVSIDTQSIEDADGGHRMDGEVESDSGQIIPVRLVSIAGSPLDEAIAALKNKKGKPVGMDLLVLFSLSPEALLKAALSDTAGTGVAVQNPLQLILYGEPSDQNN